jgi:23S rRNA (cytidine1920-2'-O)/16S rRNA (cytidine1409-2'-O)-methyltransferase
VLSVAESAATLGRGVAGIAASPLPGPAGNVEYFLWLRADAPAVEREAVERVVAEGPQ